MRRHEGQDRGKSVIFQLFKTFWNVSQDSIFNHLNYTFIQSDIQIVHIGSTADNQGLKEQSSNNISVCNHKKWSVFLYSASITLSIYATIGKPNWTGIYTYSTKMCSFWLMLRLVQMYVVSWMFGIPLVQNMVCQRSGRGLGCHMRHPYVCGKC